MGDIHDEDHGVALFPVVMASTTALVIIVKLQLARMLVPLEGVRWWLVIGWMAVAAFTPARWKRSLPLTFATIVATAFVILPNVLFSPWPYEAQAIVLTVPVPEGGRLIFQQTHAPWHSFPDHREFVGATAHYEYPNATRETALLTLFQISLQGGGWTINGASITEENTTDFFGRPGENAELGILSASREGYSLDALIGRFDGVRRDALRANQSMELDLSITLRPDRQVLAGAWASRP